MNDECSSSEFESAEDADLRAIEDALDAIANGEPGVPLDEAFAALRRKYGIPLDTDTAGDAPNNRGT